MLTTCILNKPSLKVNTSVCPLCVALYISKEFLLSNISSVVYLFVKFYLVLVNKCLQSDRSGSMFKKGYFCTDIRIGVP